METAKHLCYCVPLKLCLSPNFHHSGSASEAMSADWTTLGILSSSVLIAAPAQSMADHLIRPVPLPTTLHPPGRVGRMGRACCLTVKGFDIVPTRCSWGRAGATPGPHWGRRGRAGDAGATTRLNRCSIPPRHDKRALMVADVLNCPPTAGHGRVSHLERLSKLADQGDDVKSRP